MTNTSSEMPDLPSTDAKEMKVYDFPPFSYSSLRLPQKSRVPLFTILKEKLIKFEKNYQPNNPFCFAIPIPHLVSKLPSPLSQPDAIFYSEPYETALHLDGTMDETLLTLITSRKVWHIQFPYNRS